MNTKYLIENKYMKCVLQINRFSSPHPRVRSNRRVGSGRVWEHKSNNKGKYKGCKTLDHQTDPNNQIRTSPFGPAKGRRAERRRRIKGQSENGNINQDKVATKTNLR